MRPKQSARCKKAQVTLEVAYLGTPVPEIHECVHSVWRKVRLAHLDGRFRGEAGDTSVIPLSETPDHLFRVLPGARQLTRP